MAAFRMSFHKLNIEVQRRFPNRVARHNRLCTCCEMRLVEDEYHMLHECPAYTDIRARFADVICDRQPEEDIDTHMLRTMNPTAFDNIGIARAWRRLADFIICAMAIRHAAMQP